MTHSSFSAQRSSLPASLLLALLLLCVPLTAVADSPTLAGQWRNLADVNAPWQSFDPGRLERIVRQPAGAEVRLWVVDGPKQDSDWQMVVTSPGMERVTWLRDDGADVPARLLAMDRDGWNGHGRIAFPLEQLPSEDQPLRLRIEPQRGVNGNLAFHLQTERDVSSADARWIALVSTCLALLVGMACVALVFAVRLREATFVYYAGYLLSYAVIQLIQTGYAASPLGLAPIVDFPREWGRLAVIGSIGFSVLFLIRFAALPRYLPLSVVPLRVYAALVLASGLLGYLPGETASRIASMLVNPLIIVGGPLLLIIALLAALRGSRYAIVFVIGWTPLLLITVAGSFQLYGAFATWFSSNQAALLAAAFEAMVLSIGLADRAASMRQARDSALQLADRDALTGALNRRGLQARLADLMVGRESGQGTTLLFADIDHFKRLNDLLGHAEGDRALKLVAAGIQQEIRASDLLARQGGDEFVAVLPELEADQAVHIAERIRARVQTMAPAAGFADPVLTVSIGLAQARPDETAEALLSRADTAMYEAKRSGRNRVVQVD